MKEYKPYLYRLCWSSTNKHYIGIEYKQSRLIANPENLWVTYFTSSNHVSKYIEEHGQPDIIEVRKTFNNRQDVVDYETKLLHKLNARNNNTLLNVSEGASGFKGCDVMSDELKRNLSEKRKGIVSCKDRNGKHLAVDKYIFDNDENLNGLRFNTKDSDETRIKKSHSRKKYLEENAEKDESRKNNCRNAIKKINNMDVQCPHCNKKGKNLGSMKRWHFDNCKIKI